MSWFDDLLVLFIPPVMINILHLASLSFCFLQIDNYNSLEHTTSRTTSLFFYHIWYNNLSILQWHIDFLRDIIFSPNLKFKMISDWCNIVWSHDRCGVSILTIWSCSYANNRRIILFLFINDEHRFVRTIYYLSVPWAFIEVILLLATIINIQLHWLFRTQEAFLFVFCNIFDYLLQPEIYIILFFHSLYSAINRNFQFSI
jgi:hypothetical protein